MRPRSAQRRRLSLEPPDDRRLDAGRRAPTTSRTSARSRRGCSPGWSSSSRSASRARWPRPGRPCCCGRTAFRSRQRPRSTDPIFGRDISFFLFELPFLRLSRRCSTAWSSRRCSPLRALPGRGDARGAGVHDPVRMHLAILGGLFLLSVAFGYQLDKLELVYSTRGSVETSAIDTIGVSFTDQNAQFLAFDVLTVLSGLARRSSWARRSPGMLWPLGLTLGVWFPALILIGRAYPEASTHGAAQPVRAGGAVHREQHRDDAARVRTRRVGGRPAVRRRGGADRGGDPQRRGHVPQCPAVGLPAARRPRPAAGDPAVLRLHRRRYRPVHDRRRQRAR